MSNQRTLQQRVGSHIAVMVATSVVIGMVAAGLVLPVAAIFGATVQQVSDNLDSFPEDIDSIVLPQRTEFLDSKGRVFATVYDQNRVYVPLKDISRNMTKAILSIEDDRFYTHGAIDIKGTLRAFFTNAFSNGVVQGGSSITQQLAKMLLLQQAKSKDEQEAVTADTYARKLRELRVAIGLEQKYSKDWILEHYLNIAYFGDGAYGVQAAARHYFDTNARNLNLGQAALLAGIVKNPSAYDPTNSAERARARRDVVLSRMGDLGVISSAKEKALKRQGLRLKLTSSPNGCVNSSAPFFCDYVLSTLMADKSLGKTRQARHDLIYSGGLRIHTTLNLAFQRAADASVRKHVYAKDAAIGGLAMVEPGTGAVRALAQSRPMGSDKKTGETYLNYTVPQEYGGARGFQAGSTFKAFVLAQALIDGIPLTTKIQSPPTITMNFADFTTCDGKPYGYGTFPISTSTSTGYLDLYRGTRESVNPFYIQLEQLTGICAPFALAKSMGLKLTAPNGKRDKSGRVEISPERVPTFVFGVPDVSPLEMAEAYATFAARGIHCDSQPVTRIDDANGASVMKFKPTCRRVMETGVADGVNAVLRGVLEPGGFGYGYGIQPAQPAAGKTGTTTDGKSVWFVGYTPNLAVSAMIAGVTESAEPKTLKYTYVGGVYNGSSVTGSGTAGPMWGDAIKAIQQFLPDVNFVAPPSSIVNGGTPTKVPDVIGKSVAVARSILTSAGFNVTLGPARDSAVPKGYVGEVSPAGMAPLNSVVVIYPSTGKPPKVKDEELPPGDNPDVVGPDPGGPTDGPTTGGPGGHGGGPGGGPGGGHDRHHGWRSWRW